MKQYLIPFVFLPLAAMCEDPSDTTATEQSTATASTSAAAETDTAQAMAEVPERDRLSNNDRRYSFDNGCVIVIEPDRAVVKSEDAICELYHRDIALLYASGD